jgi:hypothetical protein
MPAAAVVALVVVVPAQSDRSRRRRSNDAGGRHRADENGVMYVPPRVVGPANVAIGLAPVAVAVALTAYARRRS